MKRILWTSFFTSILLLVATSCSPKATPTPIPTLTLNISETANNNSVKASAIVVPSQEVQMSFVISGLVKDVEVQEGDQVTAGQTLVMLDMSQMEYDLLAAQLALKTAEIDAKFARQRSRWFDINTFKTYHISPPGEIIAIADSKVEQKRFAIEVVKASIAQGTLTAPFNATVITIEVLPGEYVTPGQVVITLANLDYFEIETTDLSELNVDDVQIGQSTKVFVEALNEEYPGKVTAISPISDTIGGDVVYTVTIKLDKQPEALLWGMSADVEINTQ